MSNRKEKPIQPTDKKLLDRVRDTIRLKHYSIRTKEAYVNWIKRYIFFHNLEHPKDMGSPEIEAFLTYLAQHPVPRLPPQTKPRQGGHSLDPALHHHAHVGGTTGIVPSTDSEL